MGYGGDVSRYAEGKRVVMDEDLGPLIATEMTRCIHCTRCVRFGAEIAGIRELGATGRGENMRIGTYVAHTVAHELSGNVIDLCPVGAHSAVHFFAENDPSPVASLAATLLEDLQVDPQPGCKTGGGQVFRRFRLHRTYTATLLSPPTW